MERVIVTVKRHQETRVRDLDIPIGLEASRLSEVVASALLWDKDQSGNQISYQIQAHPPGRVLNDYETLAAAGVADGAWLTFIPYGAATSAPDARPGPHPIDPHPRVSKGPIQGWRSLNVDLPSEQPSAPIRSNDLPDEDSDSPFVWKEIDI